MSSSLWPSGACLCPTHTRRNGGPSRQNRVTFVTRPWHPEPAPEWALRQSARARAPNPTMPAPQDPTGSPARPGAGPPTCRDPRKATKAPSACTFSGTRSIESQAPGQRRGPGTSPGGGGRTSRLPAGHTWPGSCPPLTSALGGEPIPGLFPLTSHHLASDLVLGFPPPGEVWGTSDGHWAGGRAGCGRF